MCCEADENIGGNIAVAGNQTQSSWLEFLQLSYDSICLMTLSRSVLSSAAHASDALFTYVQERMLNTNPQVQCVHKGKYKPLTVLINWSGS